MNIGKFIPPGFGMFHILVALLSFSSTARPEQCPADKPSWIRGRVLVYEPNLNPPGMRGVGEVFVYAFAPGNSEPGSRTMAVSDGEGYFCIHDTVEGDWVVTSLEPFTFRPFVLEIHCTAANPCDLGGVRVDQYTLRISDDYVNYNNDWWGGPFAQSVLIPEKSTTLVKVTLRSGGESTNEVLVYQGEDLSTPLGSSGLFFPGGGGRGTAVFQPGTVPVTPNSLTTIVLGGGSGPWRLTGNAYPDGQMYLAGGNTLTPIDNTDLCLTLDIDGRDGYSTSLIIANNDGNVWGHTIVQSFVAQSAEITHASLYVGQPDGFRRIQASVHSSLQDANEGKNSIGSIKETKGLNEQGVAFGWFGGEVPVTKGNTYFLRFHFPENGYAVYTRTKDPLGNSPYPQGQLTVDGTAQAGAIWGRIMGPVSSTVMTDNDGDGYNSRVDCNDNDKNIHPGAQEICGNDIDEDCQGGDAICPNPDDTSDAGNPEPISKEDGQAGDPGGNQVDADSTSIDSTAESPLPDGGGADTHSEITGCSCGSASASASGAGALLGFLLLTVAWLRKNNGE